MNRTDTINLIICALIVPLVVWWGMDRLTRERERQLIEINHSKAIYENHPLITRHDRPN